MNLEGRTVVVTGGGHGIGKAYAIDLAARGAAVAIWDIDGPAARAVAEEIRDAHRSAAAVEVDVRSAAHVDAAAAATVASLGAVTGLVNNAGMLNVVRISRVRFEDIPETEWDQAFTLNTKGVWLCSRALVAGMREAGGGSIVNVSSSTVFIANPTRAHYVASKAAVIGLSRVMSRELGPANIRVNVVCPGSTLSEEQPDDEVIAMRSLPIDSRSLKRIQYPQDVTGTVAFLLSDESAFVTGQTIVVEGGGVLH